MAPRGRPPSTRTLVDRQLGRNIKNPAIPAGEQFVIPNHSGQLDAGTFKLTDGSVLFADNLKIAEDNSNLFWDSIRKELQPNLMKITSDGTQASPALKFNDTNTGFYKLGDSIRLSLNNSTKITIDSTGVGIGTVTPTLPLDVKAKSGISAIGGICIKLTNKTGGNSVAGQLVTVYSATAIDDAVKTAAASDDGVIGITLDAGVSDGSEMWVVVSGVADVLMDSGGSARGDRLISSATAGSAGVWNTGGAVATHFLEIGHCIESRTGAGLARCVLHFN